MHHQFAGVCPDILVDHGWTAGLPGAVVAAEHMLTCGHADMWNDAFEKVRTPQLGQQWWVERTNAINHRPRLSTFCYSLVCKLPPSPILYDKTMVSVCLSGQQPWFSRIPRIRSQAAEISPTSQGLVIISLLTIASQPQLISVNRSSPWISHDQNVLSILNYSH